MATTNNTFTATLLFSFVLLFSLATPTSSSSQEQHEEELLLTFKSAINDPASSLSDWSPEIHFCNWTGVSCSGNNTVASLELPHLNLSGDISASACFLPHLSSLNLAHNNFNSSIPLHLSQCTGLSTLNLSHNSFWGTLPDQISELASLRSLDLSSNRFEGRIPLSLGSLIGLQVLNLGANLFAGSVDPSIFANLTRLVVLDFSQNPNLASELPEEIGSLGKLRSVSMQNSGFYGKIPFSFLSLSELEVLDLSQNNFSGNIPLGFGFGNPKLVTLDLSQNKLSGLFPADVCSGKALVELSLHDNSFIGVVPDAGLRNCSALQRFQVQNNGFGGVFPPGLWSLPDIRLIRAENNRFSGQIPELASIPPRLEQVQIDNNSFSGGIPQNLGLINTLYRFSASLNQLNGSLPENFCDSPVLSIINLSHNSLSGPIPELRNCKRLVSLYLADNSFTGKIPPSLGHLPVLTYIDLSSNKLSGEIPQELSNLKLALFNVSFNRLSGNVPPSLISGLPASYLQGNPDLCGPGLPNQCDLPPRRRSPRTGKLILVLILVLAILGFLLLAAGYFAVYQKFEEKANADCWKFVFFYPLKIAEQELFAGLNDKNVRGRGAFGKVYVIKLHCGEFVAVKRLVNSGNLSLRAMRAEMKLLAKARHRNINKVLGFCFSEGEVLIIYEYVEQGSLGDVLYRSDFVLEWNERVKIALGIAQGLVYLHKDYVPRLLHRDLKSSNVLLDDDLEPRITGFGLDRVLGEASYRLSMASELSSCCYIAPEHGCNKKATDLTDVYSFGVILLELITGRPAEQPAPRESLDIVKWVRRKVNTTDGSLQVLDRRISGVAQREMLRALDLALRCTSVMPQIRPAMDEVVRTLQSLYYVARPPSVLSIETGLG